MIPPYQQPQEYSATCISHFLTNSSPPPPPPLHPHLQSPTSSTISNSHQNPLSKPPNSSISKPPKNPIQFSTSSEPTVSPIQIYTKSSKENPGSFPATPRKGFSQSFNFYPPSRRHTHAKTTRSPPSSLKFAMGLQNQLNDVSSDSIPLLVLMHIATFVNYIRTMLLTLFQSISLSCLQTDQIVDDHFLAAVGSGLAGIILLSDQLSLNNQNFYTYQDAASADNHRCVFCQSTFENGDHVRKLPYRSFCPIFAYDCKLHHLPNLCSTPITYAIYNSSYPSAFKIPLLTPFRTGHASSTPYHQLSS
ncbi:hypothetical protein RYX36_003892, partial [Vicia faba]